VLDSLPATGLLGATGQSSTGVRSGRPFCLSFFTLLNRIQLLVVGFLALAWVTLITILVLSPDVYMQALRQIGGENFGVEIPFLIVLSALIAFLMIGVFRRWRWTFWVILIAFFFGVFRLPASALQLAGLVPPSGPAWYEALQGGIGLVQFLIAIAMLAGYRKAGVWGNI
jgi:hypothetical protein